MNYIGLFLETMHNLVYAVKLGDLKLTFIVYISVSVLEHRIWAIFDLWNRLYLVKSVKTRKENSSSQNPLDIPPPGKICYGSNKERFVCTRLNSSGKKCSDYKNAKIKNASLCVFGSDTWHPHWAEKRTYAIREETLIWLEYHLFNGDLFRLYFLPFSFAYISLV